MKPIAGIMGAIQAQRKGLAQKFNQNHDEAGRFSESSGGADGSTDGHSIPPNKDGTGGIVSGLGPWTDQRVGGELLGGRIERATAGKMRLDRSTGNYIFPLQAVQGVNGWYIDYRGPGEQVHKNGISSLRRAKVLLAKIHAEATRKR
jgi:hypothetical protein